MNVKEFVDAAIGKKQIVVFSKTYCPYCKRAKALIHEKYSDVPQLIVELDDRDDGQQIQDYLLDISDQGTVPNIYINSKHIGGNDDLQAKDKAGELDEIVKALRDSE